MPAGSAARAGLPAMNAQLDRGKKSIILRYQGMANRAPTLHDRSEYVTRGRKLD